jgi:hypothetical protein
VKWAGMVYSAFPTVLNASSVMPVYGVGCSTSAKHVQVQVKGHRGIDMDEEEARLLVEDVTGCLLRSSQSPLLCQLMACTCG